MNPFWQFLREVIAAIRQWWTRNDDKKAMEKQNELERKQEKERRKVEFSKAVRGRRTGRMFRVVDGVQINKTESSGDTPDGGAG